jgi:hypothetical protein
MNYLDREQQHKLALIQKQMDELEIQRDQLEALKQDLLHEAKAKQANVFDICYQLVFVYQATTPTLKVDCPNRNTNLSELKTLSDFVVNRINTRDIPDNYRDLWMNSKYHYLTWARDRLTKLIEDNQKQ